MKTLLSRTSLLGAMLLLPGCATLAQDPQPYRTVMYSAEELDNLVAPVALYPDALLAQILVAATFPEQVEVAARYVRERGTRDIDDQGWDISVKSVAHYPPVLNMLARDEDWAGALGQAYASQSGDVMDAVQRLREMAREQGNLVSTREHTVYEDRGRIIIVPANPQVIYVPTYDPYVVYARPVFSLGFHTNYFSFGIGFPIGSWLVYDVDWWGRRVYYDGWYGGGWRHNARRYIYMTPVYVHPRYRVVNINVNIFSRRVNYINLDRRHRYVRRDVVFERHDRGRDRNVDRDRWRDDDRRGPYGTPRGADDRDGRRDGDNRGPGVLDNGGRQGGRDNDRIGNRVATFDDYRPDRGRNTPDARDAEAPVTRSGFGVIEKPKVNSQPPRGGNSVGGNGRVPTSEYRGARPNAPVFTSPPKAVERKSTGNSRPQSSEFRSAPRSNAPVYTAPPRSVERKAPAGGGAQFNRPTTMRVAPSKPAKSSSSPSMSRAPSGGGGKVKPSGGGSGGGNNRGGGGKGRKQ